MYPHIYNVTAIVSMISKNMDERNLYGKILEILRGASTGSPELRAEVMEILQTKSNEMVEQIRAATPTVSPQQTGPASSVTGS